MTDNDENNSIMSKYLTFDGRLNRLPYFLRYIGFIFAICVCAFFTTIAETTRSTTFGAIVGLFYIFVIITGLIIMLFSAIRRLHDLNMSGWWLLIRIIPIIGFVFDLLMFIIDGNTGPNKYGEDPKGRNPTTYSTNDYNGGSPSDPIENVTPEYDAADGSGNDK
ncbi:DUF805 domain-containing protein [Methanolapillus ohkumae]|uniref:DUF805 domain-containing protein n=1 Tax=Methanolapillus ohkumae TaxID=3028298 RepID=A0AA96ZX96_9EURY|nr:hypothetical protein MsAm2_05920 [Methanosarcinaceae archaeon Am2]